MPVKLENVYAFLDSFFFYEIWDRLYFKPYKLYISNVKVKIWICEVSLFDIWFDIFVKETLVQS